MPNYSLLFYETASGRRIIASFLDRLDSPTRKKIHRITDGLKVIGPKMKMPLSRRIDSDLCELRVRGKVEVRFFYTIIDHQIVILHGFIKKTMKIPDKELETARDRLHEINS